MNRYKKTIASSILLIMLLSTILSPLTAVAKNIENEYEAGNILEEEIVVEEEVIEEEVIEEEIIDDEIIEEVEDTDLNEDEEIIEDKELDIDTEDELLIEEDEENQVKKEIDKEIIYVDSENGNDDNDGSKKNPIKSLDKALTISNDHENLTEIYLLKGEYDITKDYDRSHIIKSTSIIGENKSNIFINLPDGLGVGVFGANNIIDVKIKNITFTGNFEDMGIIDTNFNMENIYFDVDYNNELYNPTLLNVDSSNISLNNVDNISDINIIEDPTGRKTRVNLTDMKLGYIVYDNSNEEKFVEAGDINIDASNINLENIENINNLNISNGNKDSKIKANVNLNNLDFKGSYIEEGDFKSGEAGHINLAAKKLNIENINNIGFLNVNIIEEGKDEVANINNIKFGYELYDEDNGFISYTGGHANIDGYGMNIKNIKNVSNIHLDSIIGEINLENIDLQYMNYENAEEIEGSSVNIISDNVNINGMKNVGNLHLSTENYENENAIFKIKDVIFSPSSIFNHDGKEISAGGFHIEGSKIILENINPDEESKIGPELDMHGKDIDIKNSTFISTYISGMEEESNLKLRDISIIVPTSEKYYTGDIEIFGITGFENANINDFLVKNNIRELEIDNCINVNINNITIEDTYKNSMYADGLINLYDIENLKVRDLNFKNNVLSIIAMDNVNYDIEDVNISIDKDFDKIIELLNKEDLDYEKLLIQYGLRDYMYSYEEDNDSKYSSIRNVNVNLSNENVDRYWLNLELEGRQLNIDRLNLKNSSNVINQTCFHAFESDIKATNMKLGDKNLMTPLLLEMEESELDLTNNTIINYEVGSKEFLGSEPDILSFDNFDEKLIKINNNILDIVKSKDLESDDCECYENLVSDIQFNNNILLNLEEEELKNNSKDNIFIDDYKELNFLDDNFKLKKDSLAVDKGNNSFLDTDIFMKDVIGNKRLYNGKIDIGAYEYNKVKEKPEQPEQPETPEENDNNTGNGSSNEKPHIGDTNTDLNKLEKKDHFAYIKGYEDKTVRANNEITREEVAMVFYRLLDSNYRKTIEININGFDDISNNRWSNKAVSTLVNGGIITGYPNNEFRPNANITRAEVAAIASRFDNLEKADNSFLDISKHWAEEYIKSASKKGWVKGYLDNTFRPDEYITRAEFVSLVNNVLERKVNKENILDGIEIFKDLDTKAWYYQDIVEATNSHNYEKIRLNDGSEVWTELK